MFSFFSSKKDKVEEKQQPPPSQKVSNISSEEGQISNDVQRALNTNNIFIYENIPIIKAELVNTVCVYPSLLPKASKFVSDMGSESILINLEGTIPIIFSGQQYNIPVTIWIVENFPYMCPVCFVTPVAGMKIKPRHPHVDPQGLIYHPYLSEWNLEVSHVLDLVMALVETFSIDPPVYKPVESVPANIVKSPLPPQGQNIREPIINPSTVPQNNGNFSPFANVSYGGNSQPAVQVNNSFNAKPNSFNMAAEEISQGPSVKDQAIIDVSLRLQLHLNTVRDENNGRLNEMLQKKDTLLSNAAKLKSTNIGLDAEKKKIFSILESEEMNKEDLELWLSTNTAACNVELDIDSMLAPADAVAKQMFDLSSEDSAISDTIYTLERELLNEKIALPIFLKHVRKLAQDQFMLRALGNKIYEKQNESK